MFFRQTSGRNYLSIIWCHVTCSALGCETVTTNLKKLGDPRLNLPFPLESWVEEHPTLYWLTGWSIRILIIWLGRIHPRKFNSSPPWKGITLNRRYLHHLVGFRVPKQPRSISESSPLRGVLVSAVQPPGLPPWQLGHHQNYRLFWYDDAGFCYIIESSTKKKTYPKTGGWKPILLSPLDIQKKTHTPATFSTTAPKKKHRFIYGEGGKTNQNHQGPASSLHRLWLPWTKVLDAETEEVALADPGGAACAAFAVPWRGMRGGWDDVQGVFRFTLP